MAEWIETFHLLFIVYVYDYVYVFVGLWLYANVCIWLRCYAYDWHVESLGIVPLNYPFGVFLRQDLALAWRLIKLCRLSSRQDPQICLCLPSQNWDWTQGLVLAKALKSPRIPESILNLNDSIQVLQELPYTPTSQSRKTFHSPPFSFCTMLMQCWQGKWEQVLCM